MSRRVTLPGADELFRSTGPAAEAAPAEPAPQPVAAPAPAPQPVAAAAAPALAAVEPVGEETFAPPPVRRRPRPLGERRPTGRERHDEKITVYCSAEELIDIERARLTLRGEYGLAADRGRIVREALAVVLADLEAKGEQSVLVRRLRGGH
ncbi:MAG TPA: cobyrinic acid a,c-diamide synthase [Mycobacteriales bacterium]|nr:cobyrinic acid a,c-diamide synthase [Mycobacteriales bacterium]